MPRRATLHKSRISWRFIDLIRLHGKHEVSTFCFLMTLNTADVVSPPENPLDFIRVLTRQLRELVAEQRRILPAADFAEMMVQLRRLFE